MAPPTLTWITTCKGRLPHLEQTLPRVVGQAGVAGIVVDYACPDGAADWVAQHAPTVGVVRVTGETGFNVARARNLGAAVAATDWLGFFDADIRWSPDFAAAVLPTLRPGSFYRADPLSPGTWGSIICHRDDFAAIGGYDEAMCGWGGEDDDLVARLLAAGCRADSFAAALIAEIDHDDALRTTFYAVKDRQLQSRINYLYMQVKGDLTRLLGQAIGLDVRRTVFAEVRRTLVNADARGLPGTVVDVTLPAVVHTTAPPPDGLPWSIERVLRYTVTTARMAAAPQHQGIKLNE